MCRIYAFFRTILSKAKEMRPVYGPTFIGDGSPGPAIAVSHANLCLKIAHTLVKI
jgi:hypothetical protein